MDGLQFEKEQDFNGVLIPNIFIDEYMSDLHGEAVKIYLYLLRYSGKADCVLSVSGMADDLHLTENDILRAFRKLESCDLIAITWNSDTEVQALRMLTCRPRNRARAYVDRALAKYVPGAAEILGEKPPVRTPPERRAYTPQEREQLGNDEEFAAVIYAAGRYLGRNITPKDADSILYYHDSLGFSWELIEYLIDYCVSKGHRKFTYIDSVALGWAEAHVTTVAEAKECSARYSEGYFKLMQTFGIKDRNLAKAELDYYSKWIDAYGFSIDVIVEACSRTILSIHKPSFEYADSILHGWKKQGVTTLEDVRRADALFQAKKSDSKPASAAPVKTAKKGRNTGLQRDYTPADIDELEKRLLARNH